MRIGYGLHVRTFPLSGQICGLFGFQVSVKVLFKVCVVVMESLSQFFACSFNTLRNFKYTGTPLKKILIQTGYIVRCFFSVTIFYYFRKRNSNKCTQQVYILSSLTISINMLQIIFIILPEGGQAILHIMLPLVEQKKWNICW